MRPIHIVQLDRPRPAVILTRESARAALRRATVAPITTRVYDIASEVVVGPQNGLDQRGVINCDNIQTIAVDDIGRSIGALLPEQEQALTSAIAAAFDLAL